MAVFPNAVVSFPTRNTGDVITAAFFNDPNAEIVAIEAGYLQGTAPLNSSNSTMANLSVTGGSTLGGVLNVASSVTCSSALTVGGPAVFSTIVYMTAQPRCHAFHGAAQSINDGTETALTFNSDDINVGGMHSTGTNPTRVTFQSTGLFLVGAKVVFAANITGNRYLRFEKTSGGSTSNLGSRVSAPPDGSNFGSLDPIALSNVIPVAVTSTGDFVQAIAFQTSGGGLNTGSATRSLANEIWAVKVA